MNRLHLPLAVLAGSLLHTVVTSAPIDAVGGASVRILGGNTTGSTARILFRESRTNDKMWCFWDTKPVSATTTTNKKAVDKRGTEGYVDLSGLSPATTYNFLLKGEGHGVTLSTPKYMCAGRLTTDGTTGAEPGARRVQRLEILQEGGGFLLRSPDGEVRWSLRDLRGQILASGVATRQGARTPSLAPGRMVLWIDQAPSVLLTRL